MAVTRNLDCIGTQFFRVLFVTELASGLDKDSSMKGKFYELVRQIANRRTGGLETRHLSSSSAIAHRY